MNTYADKFVNMIKDNKLTDIKLLKVLNEYKSLDIFKKYDSILNTIYTELLYHKKRGFINKLVDNNMLDFSKMTPIQIVGSIMLDIKLPEILPINWLVFIFSTKNIDKEILTFKEPNIIQVGNLFEFVDSNHNLECATFINNSLNYIKNITPVENKSTNVITNFRTLNWLKNNIIINRKLDNPFDRLSYYLTNPKDLIPNCINIFQDTILDKINDITIKQSIIKVLKTYTNDYTFDIISNYLISGVYDNQQLNDYIITLNNTIWHLNGLLKINGINECQNLILYRGIPEIDNFPVFSGSIINSYYHKFQSYTLNIKMAGRFSHSRFIIALVVYIEKDIFIPIANTKIDGIILSDNPDEGEFLLPLYTSLIVIDNPYLYNEKYIVIPCAINNQSRNYIDDYRNNFYTLAV